MTNIALQNKVEYSLKILSGPQKGEVLKLLSTTITVGRSSKNDIIFAEDTNCSRFHAEINISSSGIIVKSLNPKNLVQVDGKEGAALRVSHESKIKIGNTKILFQISMIIPDAAQAPALFNPNNNQNKDLETARAQQIPQHGAAAPAPKKNNFRMILIAGLVIVFLFILTEEQKSSQQATGIRTEKDIENEIEKLNKLREAEAKIRKQRGTNSKQFIKAQSHYIKGFRDYKKGKYERAIASFQACTSIFPKHALCTTYKKLSHKRFQELIQYHMIAGKKFAGKGQYSACKASFKNVMYMVKDTSSKVFQEADAKYRLCESRLTGRF